MPSVSKKQQKFMGIVRAIQKGEADPSDFNKDAQDAAKKMKKSSVKKYAKTKHKGLPNKKVNERAWTPAQEKAVKELDKKFYKLIGKKGIEPYSYEASQMWTSGGFRKEMRKIFGKDVKESLTPAEVKKERELFKKTGELPPRLQKVVDDYERERKAFHKKMKKKFKGNVKGDWVDVVVPGLEWMSKLGESAQRDYKAEYKKFQSSPKAKKYRAELNKYNRQKGTYGNGDGKDASHKGGKIVGFEAESKNRGRAEKSRLKKEINDYVGSVIDETINENPAAIAAAQRMVVQSKGKKISVNTARNSRYKDKDPAAHKKAKSLFSRLLDKFRKKNESINEGGMELKKLEDAIKMFQKKIKKQGMVTNARDEEHLERLMKVYNDMGGRKIKENSESLNWLQEKCWKGYEKKGMKTMFGKRYPNCVKKKKSESVNEVSDKQKRKIYKKAFGKEYDDSKRKQAPLPLDIAYKVALNRLKKKKKSESVNEFKTIYNKNKAAMKIRSLQRNKDAKIYKVDKKRTKYQGKDLIVYNLFTKNNNHSTNQNPYGLDMMKGAYLIPVEEGINEFHHNHISDSEKFKVYNSLKKGDIVSIKYDSSIAKGSKFHPFLVTKGKTKLMKGKIERIIMVPAGGSKAKRYLYNRNGRISLALGDMAASIIDMKKGKVNESVNEGPKIDSKLRKGLMKIQNDSYKLLANYRTVPGIQKHVKAWMDGLHRSLNQLGIMKESKELTKIDTMLKNQIKKIGKADKKAGMELMKLYKKHWVEFSIKAKKHMNEAFAIQYKKDKRYLTRKELFDKKPLKFKTEDEAKSMLNGLDHKYRTNYKIVKIKEGTCGYGMDGKLGEEPAGPHLLKKKKKKDVNEARLDPKQLLQQLGGNRFIAMTGAKNLAVDRAKNTLHMKIGRNSKGVSHLRIKLTGADLYDMEFLQVRAGNVKVKAKETGLYADQLRKMFTKHTGMYTSL